MDLTMRLFGLEQRPATIKSLVKRAKTPRFRDGEFTRVLLSMVREADRP